MYTLLGATGNVGGKIADILIKKGEKVRLVARSGERLRKLVGPNSHAFAGDITDPEFLVKAFTGSDAVFTLIPPNVRASDFMAYARTVSESIARALDTTKVKYVVNLSSWGADLTEGTGPILGLHNNEERLNRIKGLNVLHLRPANFMENSLMSIELIRSRGVNGSAARGDLKFPMIAAKDVAEIAADRLLKCDFSGSSLQALLGQRDLSMIEATTIIGKKIGSPDLRYVMLSYDDAEKAFLAAGLSSDMSKKYVQMAKALNDGRLYGTVKRSTANTTSTSFEQFCDEVFVPLYMQKKAA